MGIDSISASDIASLDWIPLGDDWEADLLEQGMELLSRQCDLADARVRESTSRLQAVSELVRLASNVVTELTTLQITVKETENKFDKLTDNEKAQIQRINTALAAYLTKVNQILNPPAGTPGTRLVQVQENGASVSKNAYDPPINGVKRPDLSFMAATDPPSLDKDDHGGDEVAKMIRTFQTEINALNQGFQLESSDAQEAQSVKLSFVEGLKSFVDKYFHLLSEIMRAA